jgi:predicted nucleic acid-binding protein
LKRALLDINVLIALLDLDHAHHRSARKWLEREVASGWASCPLTENGCVRIMSTQGDLLLLMAQFRYRRSVAPEKTISQ